MLLEREVALGAPRIISIAIVTGLFLHVDSTLMAERVVLALPAISLIVGIGQCCISKRRGWRIHSVVAHLPTAPAS